MNAMTLSLSSATGMMNAVVALRLEKAVFSTARSAGLNLTRKKETERLFRSKGLQNETIEQLGISPWPWHTFENNWVESADGNPALSNAAYACDQNDASLIAAAPELYKALYDVRLFVEWCANDPDNNVLAERARKHYDAICAALVKASGEKEVA